MTPSQYEWRQNITCHVNLWSLEKKKDLKIRLRFSTCETY